MPKEHRKRGRRGEKQKRKRDTEDSFPTSKRRKSEDAEDNGAQIITSAQETHFSGSGKELSLDKGEELSPYETPFYGLLDEQEQEYFKQADSILGLNSFADPAERDLFLENVYREAQGKELKIASSQSCSRLMERLISSSSSSQLKGLWTKFNGHFLHLFQHRFASHCCEALFRKAEHMIRDEMIENIDQIVSAEGSEEKDAQSFETLFLNSVGEVGGNIGFLITERFASHPFRVLLTILSGIPLAVVDDSALLQSKKKESNYLQAGTLPDCDSELHSVPVSFQEAVNTVTSEAMSSLDTNSIRALSTHPVANPVLQLFLVISLRNAVARQQTVKDPNSLLRKLLPDEPPTDDDESAAFISHLMYDPIGSRLVETLIAHTPGKVFKNLYRSIFSDRLVSMARNDIASFVATKILERLGKEDLEAVSMRLCEEVKTLVKRSKFGIIQTMIERSRVRGIDVYSIAEALRAAFGKEDSGRLDRMLNIEETTIDSTNGNLDESHNPDKASKVSSSRSIQSGQTHVSLLAQTMLSADDSLRPLITNSLLVLTPQQLLVYSQSRPTSQIIQQALLQPLIQPSAFRRHFIPSFCEKSDSESQEPIIVEMATHPIASHVLDAIWHATANKPTDHIGSGQIGNRGNTARNAGGSLTFLRQRIARDLSSRETRIKDSVPGKAVWRNWKMDLFKRGDNRQWMSDSYTESQNVLLPKAGSKESLAATKSGLALARERFALQRDERKVREGRRGRNKDPVRGRENREGSTTIVGTA